MLVWPVGVMVKALDLRLRRSWVPVPAFLILGNDFWHVVCNICLCHQQYNLVPVKGRWCPAAGKVSIDLALHWPVIGHHRFQWFSHPQAHSLSTRDEHPACTPRGVWHALRFYYASNRFASFSSL